MDVTIADAPSFIKELIDIAKKNSLRSIRACGVSIEMPEIEPIVVSRDHVPGPKINLKAIADKEQELIDRVTYNSAG